MFTGARDLQVKVAFVVLEPHVEPRSVLLDQRVLEDQRLALAGGGDHVEVEDPIDQLTRTWSQCVDPGEVRAQAAAEIGCLAGVHHARVQTAQQIHARAVRCFTQPCPEQIGVVDESLGAP